MRHMGSFLVFFCQPGAGGVCNLSCEGEAMALTGLSLVSFLALLAFFSSL